MSRYTGLMLVYARTGVPWRWAGHDVVQTRRGERVRVERWQAPCRNCGDDFIVHAKLPSDARRRYVIVCARALEAGQAAEVRFVVPRDRRMPAFELRNCKPCREGLRLV